MATCDVVALEDLSDRIDPVFERGKQTGTADGDPYERGDVEPELPSVEQRVISLDDSCAFELPAPVP